MFLTIFWFAICVALVAVVGCISWHHEGDESLKFSMLGVTLVFYLTALGLSSDFIGVPFQHFIDQALPQKGQSIHDFTVFAIVFVAAFSGWLFLAFLLPLTQWLGTQTVRRLRSLRKWAITGRLNPSVFPFSAFRKR